MPVPIAINIYNASLFGNYLTSRECRHTCEHLVIQFFIAIDLAKMKKKESIELDMSYEQAECLLVYFQSIPYFEMRIVERAVKGNWQTFLTNFMEAMPSDYKGINYR